MFPTTMAVHAAVPRLFGGLLLMFEFTAPSKVLSNNHHRENNADHVVSREMVPTTRASHPSAKSAADDALVVSKVRLPIADIERQ